ncbi:ABC transporter permease subunit [Pontibacillus marinus]|uniref:ABC transmembrane type-1 domain-containing protein n=1 Tax=Pontibacillus marinus BH030004 = DSM 16465 TaxID=1385511 RepID=A0A0A5HYN7_9BACI|nr:ABC transporter permease subunit [Pontibacillus marinus]KGX88732.1 hypothetical protein N783_07505 [Pontibacillus marinus BH030004 = DSM 16465]
MVLQGIRTILMWLFVTVILLLIVLLPRGNPQVDPAMSRVDQVKQYEESITTFSWKDYGDNISSIVTYAWENKSLGTTKYTHSVEYEVWRYVKKSLWLIIPSFIISAVVGLLKGVYDFNVKTRRYDPLGKPTTVFFLSVPDFFLLLFIQVAIITLSSYGLPHISLYGSEQASNKIVSIIFLSIYPTFYIARLTFASLEQQASQDYIRTAMSKGTGKRKIVWRHMLSNCWLSIISHLNTIMLYILSNLFVVELITSYRGAAYSFYKALSVRSTFAIGADQSIQTALVIEFIVVFTTIVMLTQIVSKIATGIMLQRGGMDEA